MEITFEQMWDDARSRVDMDMARCHTRKQRIMRHPFTTAWMFVWRRLRYFFTFTFPILNKVIKVKTFWGETLHISVYDVFSLARHGFIPGEEMLLTNYLIKAMRSNDVFFDVGANMGWYTVLTARLGIQVHAFEPTENTFQLLYKNNFRKDNVTLVKKAVWDKSGVIEFYDFGNRNDVSNTAKESAHTDYLFKTHYGPEARTVECEAVSLDDYCRETNVYPTFVNIDTEGSELKVLQGMQEVIIKIHPQIAVEFWKEMTTNGKGEEIMNLLKEAGYSSYIMTDDWRLEPYSLEPTEKGIITILFI